jgi:hypothetical protein
MYHILLSVVLLNCDQILHCNGNSAYIFLFWELRGLSPNFHIHVSVSYLYIPRICPHISSSRKSRPIVEIAHRHMNVEIGTEAPIFLFWEYLFKIFGILSLQCASCLLLNHVPDHTSCPPLKPCTRSSFLSSSLTQHQILFPVLLLGPFPDPASCPTLRPCSRYRSCCLSSS